VRVQVGGRALTGRRPAALCHDAASRQTTSDPGWSAPTEILASPSVAWAISSIVRSARREEPTSPAQGSLRSRHAWAPQHGGDHAGSLATPCAQARYRPCGFGTWLLSNWRHTSTMDASSAAGCRRDDVDGVLDGIPTWSVTTSWRRGRRRPMARPGALHSRGVLRLRPRHETTAPRPGGDPNLPALPQHHAVDADAGVQAVHRVLRPGRAVETSAVRGLQHLRYRRRGLTRIASGR
jgi:hypothetical protein